MIGSQASRTAEAVCLMRAAEHARDADQRVVDDPYARWFLGPLARSALAYRAVTGGVYPDWISDGLFRFVVARHRYMDDALVRALRSGVEQVVVLGAGYDMRAYRFADLLRGRPLFEVDHPATGRRKAEVLAEHRSELPDVLVRCVPVDFESESFREALSRHGFAEGKRTFFVWEGVSMYLTRPAVKATLDSIVAMSPAGGELVMDLWSLPDEPDWLSSARRVSANLLALLGEPVTFALHPEDVAAFLRERGIRTREVADAALLRERYLGADVHIYPSSYVVHGVIPARRAAGTRKNPGRSRRA